MSLDPSPTMRSMRYNGGGVVEIDDIAVPERGGGEVLVRISASALCGSEREDLLAGHAGNFGHEAAGTVVDMDAGSAYAIGELVGLYAVLGCGECRRCMAGRETMCDRGPQVLSGWHAEYAVVPERSLRKVDQSLDPATVALMTGDPLGVPTRSNRRVPSKEGQTVVVVGLGPVGLAHVLLRSHLGARVVGIEPSEYRRELAESLGADETLAPGEFTGHADIVIECTGVPAVIASSFELVDTGGTLLQSGECSVSVGLSPSDVFIHREVTYTGSWYYATEDYETMTGLVSSGFPLDKLRTHDVEASDAQQAVTEFLEGRTGKVVFRW